ncbi:MAG: TM0106 family RecB-like putative nuclease [Armatimonadota bacterium]
MSDHLTANDIRQYTLCPCGLYLDLQGPQDERAEAHAFLDHLRNLGIEHERVVVQSLPHVAIPAGSLQFRAEATLHLLHEGHERIYQPVLADGDLVGIPDLLERVEISSDLGAFSYRPVDIKISSSAKDEHRDQLAFYALLLEHTQGFPPGDADVILVDQSRELVELDERMGRVNQIVADVREVMAGRAESPTLSEQCGMCAWHDHCLRTLYGVGDVSLLDGFGPAKKAVLLDAGYPDLSAVAQGRADRLCQLKGIGQKTADRIITQARVLLERTPQPLSPTSLVDATVELYLDMECQQGTQMIYLIGVLECEEGKKDQFLAFVAERPEEEGEMWERLLEYVRGLPAGSVIYHYHNFESTHLRKLADRHGIDFAAEARLFGGLVDLHRVLKDSVVLPVHSYGLKPVAKWMGFKWRETGADAAMSMLWFDLWLSTGDRSYLDASVRYNEDDCRATKVVKEWLVTAR